MPPKDSRKEGRTESEKKERGKKRGYFSSSLLPSLRLSRGAAWLSSSCAVCGRSISSPGECANERASASVCVRTDAVSRVRSTSTAPRLASRSPWSQPCHLRLRVRRLSVCLSVCTWPCVRGASLSLWLVLGWLVALRCRRARHLRCSPGQPGLPPFLPPSPHSPARSSLEKVSFNHWSPPPPPPRRDRRFPHHGLQWTDADSNAVAATLAGRQVSLHSTIWCSKSDPLTEEQKSSLDRPDDDHETQTQDFVLPRHFYHTRDLRKRLALTRLHTGRL